MKSHPSMPQPERNLLYRLLKPFKDLINFIDDSVKHVDRHIPGLRGLTKYVAVTNTMKHRFKTPKEYR